MSTTAPDCLPLPADPSRTPLRNQYPGSCVVCGAKVAPQCGSLYRAVDGRWCTVCTSKQCYARVFGGAAADDKGRREIDPDGRVWLGKDPGALPLLRAAATWDKDVRYWTALPERGDRALVLDLADRLELAVAESWRTEPWPEHALERVAAARAAVRRHGRPGDELRAYQAEGIAWLATHPRALLADDMGLGKTLQLLFATPSDHGVVIVCPAVVKGVWEREIRKWLPERFDSVRVCKGRKGAKAFRWPASPRECVIVNYDILPPQASEGKGEPCGTPPCAVTLIADEAHALKNNKALRTKRFRSLAGHCAIVWGASGTPVDAHPFELWGTLASLGCKPLGWSAFLMGFNGTKNQWGGYSFARDAKGAILVEPGITERLRRCILRRTKGEVAGELPPKVYSEHVVAINTALVKELDEITATYADYLQRDEIPPFEAMAGVRKALAAASTKAAVDLVEQYEEQATPLVVFSAHRSPVLEIGARPGWGMIIGGMSAEARTAVVADFQEGKLLGVACTIQAAGVGITLTRASSMIFVDEDWTMLGNQQAQDRCHRIGQTAGSVDIVRLVPDHVLARHVAALLQAKETFVERTMHGFASYERAGVDELVKEDVEAWRARVDAHQSKQADDAAAKRHRELATIAGARKLTAAQAEERAGLRLRARGEQVTVVPVEAVQAAFSYMLSVCDGASTKDDVGFNSPDAAIARWVFSAVRAGSPNATTCAWTLLRHYPRQLEARWPELFGTPKKGAAPT